MLIGPFTQIVTMQGLNPKGPLQDDQLQVISEGGLRIENGRISDVGHFNTMRKSSDEVVEITSPSVVLPGFIDTHTHICYAGNRAKDYALRINGATYQEIAAKGGGILDTVLQTRLSGKEQLSSSLKLRCQKLLNLGVTTCEVKSGYGLTLEDEIKQLEVINEVGSIQPLELVSTCLAAHTKPPEFSSPRSYLDFIIAELFPLIKKRNLSKRIDIFVDKGGFSEHDARHYLLLAASHGFQICLHADQFERGGALLAAELKALSADHLEHTTEADAEAMLQSGVIPIVLPGATLGLGIDFPPARMLLDKGLPLVIASDWNPGSAPMGDLLTQAALLGAKEHLSMAETFSAITFRAASALGFNDRGLLRKGMWADFIAFDASDFREILYYQGQLRPKLVYKKGIKA